MIRLVRVPTMVNDAVLAAYLADLPHTEQAARAIPAVQRRRVVARAVLRRLLGERLNLPPRRVPLTRQRWGKPVLASTDLDDDGRSVHFSLSYTGEEALLALAQHPIGVDMESVIPMDAARVARHVYTEAECARLQAAQLGEVFLDIWTAKEAVLKFLGTGFHVEPRTFCVPPAAQDFQAVCVAHIAPTTPACVVATWRIPAAVTVAVSMACAPASITWEHYVH